MSNAVPSTVRPRSQGTTAPDPAPEVPPRPAFEIQPNKFNLQEQVNHNWTCVVPAGTLPEDLDLKPSPLALIAGFLNEGDNVRCVLADKSAIIDLIVVHRAGMAAVARVVQMIHIPQFTTQPADALPKGYKIELARPDDDAQRGAYLVRRVSDGWVMNANENHRTYQSALSWLLDHAAVRGDMPMHLLRPTLS